LFRALLATEFRTAAFLRERMVSVMMAPGGRW
jgi:hypothetical protein